ncbi:hypothetical protein LCGC14_2764260, partial [marine sediment metagenome]
MPVNIILLVIDTLRYDYVGALGDGLVRTPNLDAFAAESWVFDRAFLASFPTIPHRTDVLTGMYGGPFNPWMPLRHDVLTFPRLLAEGGYCTQLIHDTPHLVNGGHNFDWPFSAWTFIRGAEVDRPWLDNAGAADLPNWKREAKYDYLGEPGTPEAPDHTHVSYTRANRRRESNDDWNAFSWSSGLPSASAFRNHPSTREPRSSVLPVSRTQATQLPSVSL